MDRNRGRRGDGWQWHAGLGAALALAQAAGAAVSVSFSTIATNAYGTGDINSCAVDVNNLTTVGGFQFAAYYDINRNVMIARRAVGSSTWQTYSAGFSILSTEITDDHNVIAIAVDSSGDMHLSWNMHNVALNYAISNASVLTPTLSAISFTKQTAVTAPSLFPSGGTTTNEVTYPQFYPIPGSGNMLFTYRNGGTGGGSGNGDNYVDIYNPATQTWAPTFVINGEQTSVNGYTNSFAYDSTGKLAISWTWRASPDWRTNSNILYAQSPDNGVTWAQQNGTPYGPPIVQAVAGPAPLPNANQVAQVIWPLAQGSGLINQTSMAIDQNNRPMVATWWAPGWVPTAYNAGSGNPNRQYMLVYYNGTNWLTSQITSRTSDTSFDTTAANVRDLGRPIVVVDQENRVLVVMRYEDSGIHIVNGVGYAASNPGNNLVVAYTDDLITGSTITHWNFLTLDNANMGSLEPTYDPQAWAGSNRLDLFYEPVGLASETSATAKVLDWDEKAYFSGIVTFAQWNGAAGNWSDGTKWSSAPQVPNNGALPFDVAIKAGAVSLDISPTIRYLILSGGTLSGGGNLTLTSGTVSGTYNMTGTTIVNSGALTFNSGVQNAGAIAGTGSVVVSPGATLNTDALTVNAVTVNGALAIRAGSLLSHVSSLTLAGAPGAWTGQLDLANNNLIVGTGANVADEIKQAANLGTWNGTGGITSSSALLAAASSTPTALAYASGSEFTAGSGQTMFGGQAFNPTDTLVMYTLAGDANMDGAVTFADFLALQNDYNQAGDWAQGDWNYDGQVTFADFLMLQNNYNKVLAGGAVAPAVAAAPEPGALALLGLGVLLAVRRGRGV